MAGAHQIGVLTFHNCFNYGSYWQARCLVEGLRTRGQEAVILDHTSRRTARAELRCALQPLLPARSRLWDILAYARKVLRFLQELARLPRSRRFSLDRPEEMERCETVIVGSDEVWNLQHPWYGGCRAFFGSGLQAEHLASYAASFGNHSAWWGLEPVWAQQLRQFDCISVRDDNSLWLLKHSLGIHPDLVLDPCLQFDISPEGRWNGPEEPFLLVYGHGFSGQYGQAVRRWAKSQGMLVLSLGYRNDWADRQWLSAGPQDFAHAMKRADAVATNFFHGCVFALRNEKPFACEVSPYRSMKIQCLLNLLEAQAQLVGGDAAHDQVARVLSSPPADHVFTRVKELREASTTYMDSITGGRPAWSFAS